MKSLVFIIIFIFSVSLEFFAQNTLIFVSKELKANTSTFLDSPRVLDEYGKLLWRDEKIRLDSALKELTDTSDFFLLFHVHKSQKDSSTKLKNHLRKIAKHITEFRKISKEKVKFVIDDETSSHYFVRIYLIPLGVDLSIFGSETEDVFPINSTKKKLQPKKR
jgi:hypothetical protein